MVTAPILLPRVGRPTRTAWSRRAAGEAETPVRTTGHTQAESAGEAGAESVSGSEPIHHPRSHHFPGSLRSAFASLRSFVSNPSVKDATSERRSSRVVSSAAPPGQASQAHRAPEREGSGLLLPGDVQSASKALPGGFDQSLTRCSLSSIGDPCLSDEELAFDPPQLGGVDALEVRLGQPNAFIDPPESLVPSLDPAVSRGDESEHHGADMRSNDRSMVSQSGKHLGQAAIDIALLRTRGSWGRNWRRRCARKCPPCAPRGQRPPPHSRRAARESSNG